MNPVDVSVIQQPVFNTRAAQLKNYLCVFSNITKLVNDGKKQDANVKKLSANKSSPVIGVTTSGTISNLFK